MKIIFFSVCNILIVSSLSIASPSVLALSPILEVNNEVRIRFSKVDHPLDSELAMMTWGSIDDNNEIAFVGTGSPVGGVGLFKERLEQEIVSLNTLIPGTSESFDLLSYPVIDNGIIAFTGINSSRDVGGIYTSTSGELTNLVNFNTLVPNSTGSFTTIGATDFDNGDIVFFGVDSTGQRGIYKTLDGLLEKVVDTNTINPSTGSAFLNFSSAFPTGGSASSENKNPAIDGEDILFIGRSGATGLYKESEGILTTLVDLNTLVPNELATFSGVNGFAADEENFSFLASSFDASSPQGIYKDTGNGISVVADENTLVPEGVGTFEFSTGTPLAMSGDSIAFLAPDSSGVAGIYTDLGGSLIKVIDENMNLDGKQIAALGRFRRDAMNGNTIIFSANIVGEGVGLYRADITVVPEPLTILGAGTAIAFGTAFKRKLSKAKKK